MLFELYNVPSITYGIDSLFAFSQHDHLDGMAISLGHNASTVIPVSNGKGIISRAKRSVDRTISYPDEQGTTDNNRRIPWGGAQAAEMMLRLAQLKYPAFPTKVNLTQATVSKA